MTEMIEIHWTAGSLDEARKVSRYLVQQRLVACAQITPWIESVFMWNNQLETTQETKICLKTRKDLYPEVRSIIEKNCSYEIPEITYIQIDKSNESYMNWVNESTAQTPPVT